jgi:hypothetical protein
MPDNNSEEQFDVDVDGVCPICRSQYVVSDDRLYCEHVVLAIGEPTGEPDETFIDGSLYWEPESAVAKYLRLLAKLEWLHTEADVSWSDETDEMLSSIIGNGWYYIGQDQLHRWIRKAPGFSVRGGLEGGGGGGAGSGWLIPLYYSADAKATHAYVFAKASEEAAKLEALIAKLQSEAGKT